MEKNFYVIADYRTSCERIARLTKEEFRVIDWFIDKFDLSDDVLISPVEDFGDALEIRYYK